MKRFLLVLLGVGMLAAAAPAGAQEKQATKPEEKKPEEEGIIKREEVLVVSASKVEQELINAPATLSVVTADTIATSPAQNYGDLLRSTPGLNVIQTSARDINITARQSTGTLTNSQLVLLDGRSIYLDFFGLVLWDFVPQSPTDIKQIEVVRGPASAVWGANALTGVVNIITKSPREAEGFALNLNAGFFNRNAGSGEVQNLGNGFAGGGNFSWGRVVNDQVALRLTAGYFNSSPYARPVGTVPKVPNPFTDTGQNCNATPLPAGCVGGGIYPLDQNTILGYQNEGTSQPKGNLRVDQEFTNGGRMTYEGGYAGTNGIIHTGIGPFDIQNGSFQAYGKIQYSKNALVARFFGNFTDAEAPAELARSSTGQPLRLNFTTQTYDFEIDNSNVLGSKNILSYGGNARRNNFNITITPNSEDRWEFGVYLQEEFFVNKFRLAAGVRMDKFGNLADPFFSPRISAMFKPSPSHALRVSFNRAFRSPSVINNYLDVDILAPPPAGLINLTPLAALLPPPLRSLVPPPFLLSVNNFGRPSNGDCPSTAVIYPCPNLKPTSLNAWEFAYTGNIKDKTTVGLAVYQNDMDNDINFTNLTTLPPALAIANGLTFYSVTNPATGLSLTGQPVTVSPIIMGILAQLGQRLPENVNTYLNFGPLRQRGLEVSINHQFTNTVSAYANYSYQNTPKPLTAGSDQIPYPLGEISIPSANRFNAGVKYGGKRIIANADVNYTGSAFWTDVLNPEYAGYTDAFTMVNATFGVKFSDGKVITSVKGTNLLNQTIQQQIYGDLIKLALAFEVRLFFK